MDLKLRCDWVDVDTIGLMFDTIGLCWLKDFQRLTTEVNSRMSNAPARTTPQPGPFTTSSVIQMWRLQLLLYLPVVELTATF